MMLLGATGAAGALGWRLVDWHVNKSAELSERGSSALLSRTEINPRRGTIFDRTGDVLAISRGASRVVADPSTIHREGDPFVMADRLGGTLDADPLAIAEQIGDPRRRYALIARGIHGSAELELADLIADGTLAGVRLEPDRVRVYPNQELAAHVLGFVGENAERAGEINGQAGVESWYDDILRGSAGRVSADLDRLGRRIPTGRYAAVPAKHGSHLVLTIDRTIQYIAEQELDSALERYGASAGTILILNPRTGAVIALANRPSYHPAKVHEYQAYGPEFANRATSLVYEPGSTFKLITMAAGLDSGAITPDTRHDLPAALTYHGQRNSRTGTTRRIRTRRWSAYCVTRAIRARSSWPTRSGRTGSTSTSSGLGSARRRAWTSRVKWPGSYGGEATKAGSCRTWRRIRSVRGYRSRQCNSRRPWARWPTRA